MKLAVLALIAVAVIGLGFPLARSAFGSGSNEATQLMEATDRTTNKANSLNDSLSDVIPPAASIPGSNRNVPMPDHSRTAMQPGMNSMNGIRTSGPSLQPRQPGQTGLPGQPPQEGAPLPSPTPDKYAPYDDPTGHAVRDALEYLNRLQTELEPSPTEYIQAVAALQQAWTPRFNKANEEYKRFAWRIDHANNMADEYFSTQEDLTRQIVNKEDRHRAEQIDAAEFDVFLDWKHQAFKTLGQATTIMVELRDMNIIITKQSLSAHFAALYQDFHEIPPAITQLHEELQKFRAESQRIQQTFGVSVK